MTEHKFDFLSKILMAKPEFSEMNDRFMKMCPLASINPALMDKEIKPPESYENLIMFPNSMEKFTEEEKMWVLDFVRGQAQDKMYLCVIYTPSCGCEIEIDVRLDRYPMSKKILSLCPHCKKGKFLEISDPIRFYLPLLEKEYSLLDLSTMVISEGPQKEYIELYAKLNHKLP